MLANLAKTANVTKVAILAKFRQGCRRNDKSNKLTQLEGPRNVGEIGENGEVGKSGDFGEISPRLLTK